MVVFIDLDADTVERDFPGNSLFYFADGMAHPHSHIPHYAQPLNNTSAYDHRESPSARPASRSKGASRRNTSNSKGKDRAAVLSNPNTSQRLDRLFRVIGIYPCIRSIAQHLDRTDLYNLSSTCRDMHQCLLENRRHLLPFTLRCHYTSAHKSTSRRLIPSIRSPINCKTRSTKLTGQSTKRATCRACSSVSVATLTEDPTVRACVCQSKGEPWVCNNCADISMENYLLKTNKSGQAQTMTVEMECGRGTSCIGKGWYTCENFYAYLDNSGKEEKFAKRGEKVRYACKTCKQFVFNKEEAKEFLALKA
ncbi:hypothetical protein ABW20_dc0102300 [Dactylellina cionopaga]|nr:hypothetical protein ABW20_dc0102300 [Dactylellina cionopaga]